MNFCPSCSAEYSEASKFCSECGVALRPEFEATVTHGLGTPPADSDQSSFADSSHHGRFLPGTKVADRYRIVSLVGKGGMGEVYRADDLKLGHTVALKFLPADLADDPQRLEYFHREVRLTRQISHPNVCRVYDIGEVEGQQFLSMEYIDGEDLRILLRRIGRLPGDKGVQVAQQLCAGLAAAHSRGVLHRDLKPANIMIDGRGHVRVTDFGLAKLAEEGAAGEMSGTPAYMAPEQLARGETSIQSDLYSLGLILYELFTGESVFKAGSIRELLRAHEESSLSHPSSLVKDLHPAIERVILRCLEANPEERPGSAHAVAAALPGGDPLAAALAAGETPSPEMIAAAGESGRLSLKVGGGLFATICVLLLSVPFVADRLELLQLSDLADNEPAVLRKDARDWIKNLAHATGETGRPAADSAFGYEKIPISNKKGKVVKVRLNFWYRQHTSSLTANSGVFTGAQGWTVDPVNPPPTLPGMISVRLDAGASFESGNQLLEYLAVPDSDATVAGVKEKPGIELLILVGLDNREFDEVRISEAPFGWQPPIYADHVEIWRHKTAEPALHVVIATRGGRIVYFRRMTGQSDLTHMTSAAAERRTRLGFSPLAILTIVFAGFLALRNVRMGRSDTRGALRCSLYFFAIYMAMWPLAIHHTWDMARELTLGLDHLIRSMAFSLRLWLYYVALEPYVRRFWPDMLIGWNRVLSGRIRDPLVGRDLMMGCLFGAAITLLTFVGGRYRGNVDVDTVIGTRYVLTHLLNAHQGQLVWGGLANLALLLLLRLLLRKNWAAGLAVAAINTIVLGWTDGLVTKDPLVWFVMALWAGALVLLLFRYGLLSVIAGQTVLVLLLRIPYTANFGTWYAYPGTLALALALIVAGYGFYTSTLADRTLAVTVSR